MKEKNKIDNLAFHFPYIENTCLSWKEVLHLATPINIKKNQNLVDVGDNNINFNTERVEALLKNGADVHAKDNDGDSVIKYTSHSDFVNVLVLEKYGADINAKDKDGHGVLFYAASFSIDNLLKAKSLDLETRDEHGHTPLMIPNPRVQEELIKAGANVNALNNYNQTALMIAPILVLAK